MKGWCKRNYHTDGKRRFGELVGGLCIECCSPERWRKATRVRLRDELSFPKAEQVRQIIKEINEVSDPGKALMRQGFNQIDELGIGFEILGYPNDEKYLTSEFKCRTSYLRQQRTCGRIERIMGIDIGTYSFDDLYPLFQFRVVMRGKTGSKPKFNHEAVDLIRETWEKAKKLAKNQPLPNRQHIISAVEQMAKLGKAKPVKIRRRPKWEHKYKALLGTCLALEKENQQLRKELGKFPKEPKKPLAQTVEEYHEKMNKLYQEQARQQYQ